MPYIFTSNAPTTCPLFEKFNLIVEKYKDIIENNATARCMIGFTAASFIRNEGDIDIDSLENWLQSVESDCSSFEEEDNTQVNRILDVVKHTTITEHIDEEMEEEEESDSGTNSELDEVDEFEDESKEVYELNRFISRDPYSCTESYPTYTYHSRLTFVKQSESDSIHVLNQALTTPYQQD
jgi:hypothetical protein